MPMFKKVVDLKKGSASIIDVLSKYVFGNVAPTEYNPNTVYKKGELVLREVDGKVIVLQAIVEETTEGEFISSEWTSGSVAEVTTNSVTGVVSLSKFKPEYENNQLWLIPIDTREQVVIDYEEGVPSDVSRVTLIFEEEDYPITEDEDLTNTDTPLYFDPESESTTYSSTLDDSYEMTLDEGEVLVSNTAPDADDEDVVLWIDTDISDDNV